MKVSLLTVKPAEDVVISASKSTHRIGGGVASAYNEMFSSKTVETAEELDEVFKLRYQVYCLENPFENPEDNENERETDDYDNISVHSLLIHRPSGLAIGSTRNIMPNKDDWRNSFPMQSICNSRYMNSEELVLAGCEASRFCVSKTVRNRVEDTHQYTAAYEITNSTEVNSNTKRSLPYTSLGLITASLSIPVIHKLPYVYAVMEPKLIKFLIKLGVECEQIADPIEYHGLRIPAVFLPLAIYENTYKNHPDTWKIITEEGRFHQMALDNATNNK